MPRKESFPESGRVRGIDGQTVIDTGDARLQPDQQFAHPPPLFRLDLAGQNRRAALHRDLHAVETLADRKAAEPLADLRLDRRRRDRLDLDPASQPRPNGLLALAGPLTTEGIAEQATQASHAA